jgi:hypothetical protein
MTAVGVRDDGSGPSRALMPSPPRGPGLARGVGQRSAAAGTATPIFSDLSQQVHGAADFLADYAERRHVDMSRVAEVARSGQGCRKGEKCHGLDVYASPSLRRESDHD